MGHLFSGLVNGSCRLNKTCSVVAGEKTLLWPSLYLADDMWAPLKVIKTFGDSERTYRGCESNKRLNWMREAKLNLVTLNGVPSCCFEKLSQFPVVCFYWKARSNGFSQKLSLASVWIEMGRRLETKLNYGAEMRGFSHALFKQMSVILSA